MEYEIGVETGELPTVTLPDDSDGTYWTPVPPVTVVAVLHGYVPGETALMVMLAVVEEYGFPLKVTDQLVPAGRPVSVNVTEGKATKFAVMVPAPSTVAVDDELVAEERVIEVVDDVHEPKAYPGLGVALIDRPPPELTQVAGPGVGDVVPPVPAAMVTWYCVV